jgi:diguanylate cyclase (GGDEF)-like protein/PAS domain S-box-containing protein
LSELFQRIIQDAPVALFVLDASGVVTVANREAVRLVGAEPVGRRFESLFVASDQERVRSYAGALVAGGARASHHLEAHLDGDGLVRAVEARGRRMSGPGPVPPVVVAVSDVTDHRRRERALARRTLVDPLTGLPTRAAMEDALSRAHRSNTGRGALAFVDLDRFKVLNNRYGHDLGDHVLGTVARRLAAAAGDEATVARVGGDEFAVLLPRSTPDEAFAVMTRVVEEVTRPVVVADTSIEISVSAGLSPLDAASPGAVLRQADAAMYEAKKSRSNRVVLWGPVVAAWADNLWELAATVARLEHHRDQLLLESRTDHLTGLPNRRALEEAIPALAEEAARTGRPFSVLFIDLDRFGAFNKRRGDAKGDAALHLVARTVEGNCRERDTAFRKGGEELVLLLPDTGHAEALAIGERIRGAVERLEIAHDGHPDTPVITVTVGVATAGPGDGPEAVLKAASAAALRSKVAEHRNRTVSAHDPA